MYKPRGWHIAGGIEQRASFLVQIERVCRKGGENERGERSVGNGGVWFKRGRRRVGAYDGPSSKGLERGERGGMMDGRSPSVGNGFWSAMDAQREYKNWGEDRMGAYDGPSSKKLERGERGGMMDEAQCL